MTRDEFIDSYLTQSNALKLRTPDGYQVGNRKFVALECHCGEEMCRGWAMVRADPDEIEWHQKRNGRASRDG